MRWEHRGRQRLLDVEQRAEIHEDRRPKPEFLRARAERDLEFGMAQIISLAPQRVVVNPILVGDERLVAVGVGGVRDTLHARPHAADVEAAELRFAELEAIDDADRSEEHPSELQTLMRISYAVLCL